MTQTSQTCRIALASRARFLLQQNREDPQLQQEQMEDCARILRESDMLPTKPNLKSPSQFVEEVFQDNYLLDNQIEEKGLRSLLAPTSLTQMAYALTPHYPDD